MDYNKVFGIGFHKTGTTSLAFALTILGFRNNRGLDILNKIWGKDKCVDLLRNKDYQPFFEFIKQYDSTLDNPWYILYQELDKEFPNSKFILTIREEKNWLRSCKNYFRTRANPVHSIIYGVDTFPGNEQIYLERYQNHVTQVKSYFKYRSNDLLVLNWEEGHGWEEICKFLKKPTINLPFPHLNKGKSIKT